MSKEITPKDPQVVEAKPDDEEREAERTTTCVRFRRKSARKMSAFRGG